MAKEIVETPLMKQYIEMKAQHPDAILLFRVGDFYETFSDDAIVASEILGITLTRRANGAAQYVELAGFPHHALDTYLPKLVRAGKRVAICEQLEDPKLAKKLVKRGITELVTPGVSINDNILDHKENNFLGGVHFGKNNKVGVAFLDISTGEFLAAEGDYDYVDKLLGNFAPKEVLFERTKRKLFEEHFGNRFFTFNLASMQERSRALDARIYRQDRLLWHYSTIGNVFCTKGSLAACARGPMGLWGGAAAAVSAVFTGLVYAFVCLKAWAGAFAVGSVAQYIGAITALSGSVGTLVSTWGEFRANAVFLRQTYKFLDTPSEMYQGSLTTEKRSDRNYEIEFRDVSFRYPGAEDYALRHVSMKFRVGERLAVVGENGSGKTTFIKLLCRLYDPTEGTILLNGIDIRKYDYDEYIALFSVVFQDFQLLSFSLGQNVAAAVQYNPERAKACLQKAGFGDRLAQLPDGLETKLYKDFDEKGVQISGGEAQKIALARALYKDAPFVVLDEPTAALDPIAEMEVYEKFNEIVGDRTAVYISHRLSSCRFCDSIAVFDHGSIIQRGTHESLLQNEDGKYFALWNAQAQYYVEH